MDQEQPDPIPSSEIDSASSPEFGTTSKGTLQTGSRGLQARPGDMGYPLHSGRTLRVSAGPAHQTDQMEILSPDGQVEVEILLTANGPMVRVHGGSLKMTSTQSIQLESAGPVEIKADELRVRTTRSVHLDGETIRLNCQDQPTTPRPTPQPPTLCDRGCGPGNNQLNDPNRQ